MGVARHGVRSVLLLRPRLQSTDHYGPLERKTGAVVKAQRVQWKISSALINVHDSFGFGLKALVCTGVMSDDVGLTSGNQLHMEVDERKHIPESILYNRQEVETQFSMPAAEEQVALPMKYGEDTEAIEPSESCNPKRISDRHGDGRLDSSPGSME